MNQNAEKCTRRQNKCCPLDKTTSSEVKGTEAGHKSLTFVGHA